MRIERRDGFVETARVVVVQQQAHPHATLGRLPQGLEQEIPGMVAVPDVVLHIERALRGAGEKDTCRERVTSSG